METVLLLKVLVMNRTSFWSADIYDKRAVELTKQEGALGELPLLAAIVQPKLDSPTKSFFC